MAVRFAGAGHGPGRGAAPRCRLAVAAVSGGGQAAQDHQRAAGPDPADERLVEQVHDPAAVGQAFAQRGVEIAQGADVDGRLRHRHRLRHVVAGLRPQRGDMPAAARDIEGGARGDPVGASDLLDAAEGEGVPGQKGGLARQHAHVQLGLEAVDHGDADDEHAQAEMGQPHAPPATGDAAQAGGGAGPAAAVQALRQQLQAAQHDPGRQRQAQAGEPGEVPEAVAQRRAQQRAGERGRPQAARQPLPGVGLPARHGAGHQQHEHRRHQRHEGGVEVGRSHRNLAQAQGVEQQRVEGAEQHRRAGHGKQRVVGQQGGVARYQLEVAAALQPRGAPGV